MEINELRVGNIVGEDIANVYPPNFIAGIRSIILIEIKNEYFEPVQLFIPITFTEEWYKRFYLDGSQIEIQFISETFEDGQKVILGAKIFYKGIEIDTFDFFVHSFQNLYFALTGNELIIQ